VKTLKVTDRIIGDLTVEGKIKFNAAADCAEEFEVEDDEALVPGSVMVVGESGKLRPCCNAYDTTAVGVISGAGDYKPGLVLDHQGDDEFIRCPIALIGKVNCLVDATYAPIRTGDLVTTSATHGHAMRASDPLKSTGAIIGKALAPAFAGQQLIPILVTLQ
jgi:hypothetical protein